MRSTSLMIL